MPIFKFVWPALHDFSQTNPKTLTDKKLACVRFYFWTLFANLDFLNFIAPLCSESVHCSEWPGHLLSCSGQLKIFKNILIQAFSAIPSIFMSWPASKTFTVASCHFPSVLLLILKKNHKIIKCGQLFFEQQQPNYFWTKLGTTGTKRVKALN